MAGRTVDMGMKAILPNLKWSSPYIITQGEVMSPSVMGSNAPKCFYNKMTHFLLNTFMQNKVIYVSASICLSIFLSVCLSAIYLSSILIHKQTHYICIHIYAVHM